MPSRSFFSLLSMAAAISLPLMWTSAASAESGAHRVPPPPPINAPVAIADLH